MMIRQIHGDSAGRPAPVERTLRRRLQPRVLGLALIGAVALTAASAVVMPGAGGLSPRPVIAANPSPSPTGKAGRYCQDFIGHLSKELGISTDKLQAAMTRAARQTLDDAVTRGDLTRAQADAIRTRMAGQPICSVNWGGMGMHQMAQGVILTAAAKTLHMAPDQLMSQLSEGKTVSQIAPAGMTEQQFASGFQANLKPELDAQVKAGNLTSTQETRALNAAPAVAQHLWTHGAPWPRMSPSQTGSPAQQMPSP